MAARAKRSAHAIGNAIDVVGFRFRELPCRGLERLYRLEGDPIVHCNIHMSSVHL